MDHVKPWASGLGHTIILFPHPPAMTAGIHVSSLKVEDMKIEEEKYWLILPTARGLFVHFSRLIESLSHYAAASAQVCDHRARPFSNLSTFSPSVKFSLSDDESSLDTSYLRLDSSLIVKLAQKIT